MGMWSRFAARIGFASESRSLAGTDVYGSDFATAHEDVSGDRALRIVAVFAAVSLVADMIALLPIAVYRKMLGARSPRPMPAWLANPDRRITRYDWVFQAVACLMLRGNAYGLVLRVNGVIDQVLWLHPSRIYVDESGTLPVYRITGDPKPHWATTLGGDILHVRAFTLPGSVVGLSPVGLFRTQFQTAQAATEYGRDWFDNSAMPSGILQNENATLSPEQTKEAKDKWLRSVRTGEPVALDKHWSWTAVSLSPNESQFLETIRATANQIAAIFRVDPEDVGGEAGNGLKYTTVEGNQRKFNIRTAMSWCVRLEHAIKTLLDDEDEAKFNLDALARPNTLERAKATTEELNNGTLTLPEARAREDRSELSDEEITFWRDSYRTTRSQSESDATSISIQPEGD